MRKIKLLSIVAIFVLTFSNEYKAQEQYGKTLNTGLGIGYYGYRGYMSPAFHVNYEFDVAKNFTIAPFISAYGYKNTYYWGNKNYPYRYYYYRETIVPIGVKGTYYFDQLLKANEKWDFYLAGSLGYTFRKAVWESNYYGDRDVYRSTSNLYLNGHIGAEYHASDKLGIFLDLSSGMSTAGLAIHL